MQAFFKKRELAGEAEGAEGERSPAPALDNILSEESRKLESEQERLAEQRKRQRRVEEDAKRQRAQERQSEQDRLFPVLGEAPEQAEREEVKQLAAPVEEAEGGISLTDIMNEQENVTKKKKQKRRVEMQQKMMDKIVRPPSDWTFLENPKWAAEKEPQELPSTASRGGGAAKDGTSLEEIMKEQEKGKKKRKKID